MKKNISILIAPLLIFSCTSSLKHAGPIESDDHASFKGITRSIAQEVSFPPVQEIALPTDPYIVQKKDKTFFDCKTIKKVNYTFSGKVYEKLRFDDDVQLKCPNVKAFNRSMPWVVLKDTWSETDEQNFSAFVKRLGAAKCKNLDRCLSSEASNSLISEEDMYNLYYADCADLPYYLRGYFAYKNHLPFSFVGKFQSVPLTDLQIKSNAARIQKLRDVGKEKEALAQEAIDADIRYSQNGNMPVSQLNTPNTLGARRDFSGINGGIKSAINDAISTGSFRMLDGDLYASKVSAEFIRPGTVVYGVKGHAAVVYDIKPNGEILVMDAHPGNSITHKGWMDDEFILDSSKHGGMFRNWRPIKVTNPKLGKSMINGQVVQAILSGQLVQAKDEELPGYSLEQYDSNNFVNNGKKITMREWSSLRISAGRYRFDPLADMIDRTNILCEDFKGRISDVEKAMTNGITKLSLAQYPNNIYGAEGDWETYSSPSSDLRRRTGVLGLIEMSRDAVKRITEKDPMVSYKGSNIRSDLIAAFKNTARNCIIIYKNTLGAPVSLNLIDLSKRAGLFSFDPYMCPEARWGASGDESKTCTDSAEKRETYRLTQFLRNTNIKDEGALHGYTLSDLKTLEAQKKVNNNSALYNYDVAAAIANIK